MARTLVLSSTQTTSDLFYSTGEVLTILFRAHTGGTWVLEVQGLDGNWTDISPDPNPFIETGMWYMAGWAEGFAYRFTGGNLGAEVEVS